MRLSLMLPDSATSRGWIAPPVHPNAELTRRALALWNTGWGTLGIGSAFLAVMIALEPESAQRRAATILGLGVIAAMSHEASRRGRTTEASWAFLALVIAFLTQRAWITGGIHAPILPLYVITITMGGVLLGGRGAWAAAGASVLGSALLVAGERFGWLAPPQERASPVAIFLFTAMILGLSLLLQRMVTRSFRVSLRRAEDALLERDRLLRDLERLVDDRTRELRGSLERLQELEGLRDDLTRMVVHDMRGQLLVVLANLELARTAADGKSAGDIDQAVSAAEALTKMANTLLDVSRLEEGKMPLAVARCDLTAVVGAAAATLGRLDPSRTITVTPKMPVVALCDHDLIRRVVENLIGNAIKHTPAGGHLRIHATAADGRVRVAVHDDGPGIPADSRARIFEKFGSTKTRGANAQHAAGLGLAFCKLAVEAHGGTIGVEPASPSGSVFTFDLPAGDAT